MHYGDITRGKHVFTQIKNTTALLLIFYTDHIIGLVVLETISNNTNLNLYKSSFTLTDNYIVIESKSCNANEMLTASRNAITHYYSFVNIHYIRVWFFAVSV